MRKYSKRSLAALRGIHPDLRRVIDRALRDSPVDFTVIEGLRTKERQAELVRTGASKTMKSRHITGHAVDLLPIGPDGKAAFAWPLYDRLAPAIKAAAQAEGVEIVWGGDWKTFRDGPHFELSHDAYPATKWTTGDEPPKARTNPMQSSTVQASGLQIMSGLGTGVGAVAALDGTAQIVALVFVGVGILAAAWIMRERLRKWAEGDR